MALPPCTPCTCIPGTIGNEKFKQDIELILCGILEALAGAGSNVNLTGINGVAPSVNNGSADAGTLRVTIADDSTGVINVTEWAGNPISTNAGNVDAGTLRVTLVNNTSIALTENAVPGNGPVRIEDTAFAAAETVMLGGTVRQDVLTTDTSADGDIQPVKSTASGAIYSSVTAVIPGTNAINLGKEADGARPGSGVGVAALAVRNDTLATLVSADLDYSETSVDLAGRQYVAGQVAHDAPVSGNPVLAGAEARSTFGTLVLNGDAVRLMADLSGRLVTAPHAPSSQILTFSVTLGSTADVTLVAAPGVTSAIVVLSITFDRAAGTADNVSIYAGSSAGTRLDTASAVGNSSAFHPYPAGIALATNTALVANSDVSTTWVISGTYFIRPT